MRVLVVDESAERAELLREALLHAGYEVTASLSSPLTLLKTIEQVRPDVIVIDTDSPSRDVLEHLVVMSQHTPRPVVMFASDGAPETIRAATRAGVCAYVVGGVVEHMQRLRAELAEANQKLSERKLVERAKGLLMKERGVDEQEAYRLLRSLAMNRGKRIGEVAQDVIAASELLGRA